MYNIMDHRKSSRKCLLLLFMTFLLLLMSHFASLGPLLNNPGKYTFLGSQALSFESILHTSVVEGGLIDKQYQKQGLSKY